MLYRLFALVLLVVAAAAAAAKEDLPKVRTRSDRTPWLAQPRAQAALPAQSAGAVILNVRVQSGLRASRGVEARPRCAVHVALVHKANAPRFTHHAARRTRPCASASSTAPRSATSSPSPATSSPCTTQVRSPRGVLAAMTDGGAALQNGRARLTGVLAAAAHWLIAALSLNPVARRHAVQGWLQVRLVRRPQPAF